MSNLPTRQTIEQFDLKDPELVQLYLELIRIIEKDIDDLRAGDTRNAGRVGH